MHPATLGIAWIERAVLDDMLHEATRRFPLETGGVLIGYWADDGNQLVIGNAIGPGPNARHKRYGFVPDQVFHETEIARIYAQSGRTHVYLGDWHTHPRGSEVLSVRDRRTLQRIAEDAGARAETPVMAIFAGGPDWRVALWRYIAPRILIGASVERVAVKLYKT